MTKLDQFSTQRAEGHIDPNSPLSEDMRLVALILQQSVAKFAQDGLQAIEADNTPAILMLKAATDATIGIAGSIAINLPVNLQRAFLDATGMYEELAERLLAKMRSEVASQTQ